MNKLLTRICKFSTTHRMHQCMHTLPPKLVKNMEIPWHGEYMRTYMMHASQSIFVNIYIDYFCVWKMVVLSQRPWGELISDLWKAPSLGHWEKELLVCGHTWAVQTNTLPPGFTEIKTMLGRYATTHLTTAHLTTPFDHSCIIGFLYKKSVCSTCTFLAPKVWGQ